MITEDVAKALNILLKKTITDKTTRIELLALNTSYETKVDLRP